MRVTFSIPFYLVLVASPTVAAPAEAPDARSGGTVQITLVEAIQQALVRNPDLAVTRRDIDIGQGRLRQARLYPFNPELVVEGEAGRAKARGEEATRRTVGGGSVGLAQVVEIRGQRALRIRGAESDLARTEWAVRDAEREIVAQTTQAFSNLLLAQKRLSLAREVVALLTTLRNTADELARGGAVPELDALRAEVELRRATNRVTLEEGSVAAAARSLALFIGGSPGAVLRATGPLLFDPVPGTREELLALARANRPDLRAADAAMEGARTSLRLIEAERFVPAVTLSLSYAQAADFDSTNRRGLLGLSIPLPLLNRREGDLAAAAAEVGKQDAARGRIVAQTEKEVATALDQVAAARRVVEEFVRRIVPGQEESAKLIQEGYRYALPVHDAVHIRTGRRGEAAFGGDE